MPEDIERCVKAVGDKAGNAYALCNWMKNTGKGYFASHADDAAIKQAIHEYADVPEVKPPLVAVKLAPGHEDDEALLRGRTDIPSMGWVQRVYVEGDKLKADVGAVPDLVANLIKQGSYKTVSAEVYPNFEYQGKSFGPVLRRVGVLGGELPQIKTLQDIPTPANGEIKGLDIFQAGNHRDHNWTQADLEAIAANFDRLSAGQIAAQHADAGAKVLYLFSERKPAMKAAPKVSLKHGAAKLAKLKAASLYTLKKFAECMKHDDAVPASPPQGDAPAPQGVSRDDLVSMLADWGVDPAALEGVPDAALAEVVRVISELQQSLQEAKPAPQSGQMADAPNLSPTNSGVMNNGPEGINDLHASGGISPPQSTPAVASGLPTEHPTSVTMKYTENGKIVERTVNFSELMTPLVQAATKAAVEAAVKPLNDQLATAKGDIAKFSETTKKSRIDAEIAELVKAGKVTPAEVEAGLASQLARADGVAKFSDGETEFDKQLKLLHARPATLRFGNKASQPDKGKDTEEQKVLAFAETVLAPHLEANGRSVQSYVATFTEARKKNPKLTAKEYGVSPEYCN